MAVNAGLEGIIVPIGNSEEYVQITPDELPDSVDDYAAGEIVEVLQAELAPLRTWIALAVSPATPRLPPLP
jgi:hypothetical protein